VLSAVDVALIAAAFGAGLTGTWSPCGFSMVETIGPTGHTGGIRTTLAACATFLPGAILGGVFTFGVLSTAGALLHDSGRAAYIAAAVIATAAALIELRGGRIAPQVRRQLPEHWRRLMPMPVAAGLYGVLLGLGFTTFVLSFGVWALAGISFALGAPVTGLMVGIAFGAGRALPVVALAPLAGRRAGVRAISTMAERPSIYRGFRLGDAALFGVVAVVLAGAQGAVAAKVEIKAGANPSVVPNALVWQAPDGTGFLESGSSLQPLPGNRPAVGGPYVALIAGDEIKLLDRHTLQPLGSASAPGADAVAVSKRWLVYRVGGPGGDLMVARRLQDPANPGGRKAIARTGRLAQLSRPSLDHGLLVFARDGRRFSRIVRRRLAAHRNHTVLSSSSAGLFNPSIKGGRLAYVRSTRGRDRLMIRARHGHGSGHAIFSSRRRSGWIWSTALTKRRVFFTILRYHGTQPSARIVSQRFRQRRHHR
jgi:hypothetical protein